MGSWSVYCGISNITINSGRKCVFLPLQKNKTGEAYDKYIPATLPIFGEYDDYGSLEDIVEDFNTKLIEEVYGCTIQEFVSFLVDVRRDYNNEYSDWHGKENLKPLEDFEYMWIDGEVYDFLRNFHPIEYDRAGYFDIGNPDILNYLGFVHVGESGVERFTQKYVYDKDGVNLELVSDGTWAHYKTKKMKKFDGSAYNMSDFKKLGVDVLNLENIESQNAHRILNVEKKFEKLGYIIGIRYNYYENLRWFKMMKELAGEVNTNLDMEFWVKQMSLDPMTKKYASLISTSEEICDGLADLVTIRKNMHSGSYTWTPMKLYLTPQCGEYKTHQKLLEGFAKINSGLVGEEEDDDES